jgi:hypothetical protein
MATVWQQKGDSHVNGIPRHLFEFNELIGRSKFDSVK